MTKDEENMNKIPDLIKELTVMTNESMTEYEERINRCLDKTSKAFEAMVDTGVLATDPQTMVEAMKVLTKAKIDIADNKRRIIDTAMRGFAMKQVTSGKKPMTALDKWNERMILEGKSIKDTESNGMFGEISKEEE